MLPTSSSDSSIMLKLFKLINRLKNLHQNWNYFHISIVGGYISNLSTTCHFPHLPSAQLLITHLSRDHDRGAHHPMVVSFKQELKKLFTVPKLNTFYQTQNQINKFHLLEAFLSLLLQLLYHKTPTTVGLFKDRIDNLEKELRFLLTILGDISWMLLDKDEVEAEFQNLLPEFEALANQAGSFVHYLFFSPNYAFERIDEELAAVLNQTYLLEANLESSISASAYTTTPKSSMVDSILILDSVVEDLEGVLKREYHQIADVKDQLIILHHELLLSHSLIKDMRSPQPLEIEEVKEAMMRIGGVAHQAEYLITSFLVKDAPLWYVFKRLTHLNQNIVPIRTELQDITQNYKFGGLTVAELPFHDKRNTEVNDVTVGFEDKTNEILYQLVDGGTESLQVISILGMPGLDWNISNQTNNLEYLSFLNIRKLKDEEGLKCSPHLRKLKCRYRVDDGACPHFDLRFLTRLESLFLEGSLRKKDFGFPSNIRKLSFYETFLPWEKMSVVGRLECLEVLKLYPNAFVGERWDTRGCEFQKLRFLKLDSLSSLREWNVASDEHFPKLQQLILIRCTNLQEIPSELGDITALELIEVELMGGQLTVSSVEHHGSTFTFVLPYKVSSKSDDPDELSDTEHQDGTEDDLHSGQNYEDMDGSCVCIYNKRFNPSKQIGINRGLIDQIRDFTH
ncbi:hypothetical protein ACS0TY_022880 [Phlomoides rotata]